MGAYLIKPPAFTYPVFEITYLALTLFYHLAVHISVSLVGYALHKDLLYLLMKQIYPLCVLLYPLLESWFVILPLPDYPFVPFAVLFDPVTQTVQLIGNALVKAGLYHYLSMAKTNYHAYFKGEQVKLKKYFYVLRPLLACRHIIDNGKPLPMLFSKLVEIELESAMKPFVDEILKAKMATSELGTQPQNDKVIRYFESSIAEIEKVIADYFKAEKSSWEPLDKCFLDILNGNVCP